MTDPLWAEKRVLITGATGNSAGWEKLDSGKVKELL
jgi:hypothetical protein